MDKVRSAFKEAVALIAAPIGVQKEWLSSNDLAGVPEEIFLQFDDLKAVQNLYPDALAPGVEELDRAIELAAELKAPEDRLLNSAEWDRARSAARALLGLMDQYF